MKTKAFPGFLILAFSAVYLGNPFASRAQNLYVSDLGNDTVGEYDPSTGDSIAGFTIISGLNDPEALAVSGTNLFVLDASTGIVSQYNATTGATINGSLITGLNQSGGLAISGGDLYVGTDGNVAEYDLETGFRVTSFALSTGVAESVENLAVSGGDLYAVNSANPPSIGGYDATSGAAIAGFTPATFISPVGLAISGTDLFVSDSSTGTVGEYNAITGAAIDSSLISGLSDVGDLAVSGSDLYVANDGVVSEYLGPQPGATPQAVANATPQAVKELGALAVSPVPEPQIWSFFAAGVTLLGGMLGIRRGRKV
jgi:hypothetical protein